ncbi:hypothetical protein SAMN04488074_106349 [Lentzea albidocapillata subsp. violacea]|uniref:Uncharacterized protein n=1 Tax=Lentzea albidocapillata subsp. violacea TaxID=128104 RepID=A0A1G9DQ90_9PSEU|nr:hypothetical protein [Lentzea albidocapillata]SDK66019.1 hypothetical protein SAMN04488074_106349 [Lentzea albidocapillata subsp. violacea]
MSWLRRLLLLAGLVTGAWLLGGAGEANADVRVEIDQLRVEVKLPVADIGLTIATTPPQQPDGPIPPKPAPRIETPEPTAPQPPAQVGEAPVQAEVPQQPKPEPPTTRPATSVPEPQQPQPQAEQPIPGTLPQSGAGASAGSTQIPAGTLPHVMRPPTITASLVSTEQQDVPRIVRAEEPTFSPD